MINSIKDNIIKVYGQEPSSLNELADCIIKVIESQTVTSFGKTIKVPKVVGFAWDVAYNELVYNGHCSPVGRPQNWSRRDPSLPDGYPGWQGRVWIRYETEPFFFGSDPFRATLTHPGSGGAGHYNGPWKAISGAMSKKHKDNYPKKPSCYSWDYKFFKEDWPKLADWVDKQLMWSNLHGKVFPSRHIFSWTDSETLEKDTEFLKDLCYNNN